MKVVAINGSARKDGNTAILVRHVFSALEEEGIETELVELAGYPVHGCNACYGCMKERNRRCIIDDDIVNGCIGKMEEAEGSSSRPRHTLPMSHPRSRRSWTGRASLASSMTPCSGGRSGRRWSRSGGAGPSMPLIP